MSARLPRSPWLRRLATAPQPVWPRPIDAACEWWARLPPRVRLALIVAAIAGLAVASELRVQAAESRWGGEPVEVLTATEDRSVGAPASEGLRRVRLPPEAVPDAALADVADDAALAAPLPAGAVLTELHVSQQGPAAGLQPHLRVVPVAVEEGWGVEAGGWVDVWVDPGAGRATEPVATRRPVVDVRDGGSRPTALVGLHADEVGAVTAAGRGGVRLTHAPPPEPDGPE
jgi:hypothetical protein